MQIHDWSYSKTPLSLVNVDWMLRARTGTGKRFRFGNNFGTFGERAAQPIAMRQSLDWWAKMADLASSRTRSGAMRFNSRSTSCSGVFSWTTSRSSVASLTSARVTSTAARTSEPKSFSGSLCCQQKSKETLQKSPTTTKPKSKKNQTSYLVNSKPASWPSSAMQTISITNRRN